MKTFFSITISLLIICYSTSMAQWEHLGLSSLRVNTLKISNDCLYTGTSDGVYRINLIEPDAVWNPIGLQGEYIKSLLVLNTDTIFAGLVIGSVSIYWTTNGGTSWQPFVNGFGGGEFHPVFSFERIPGQVDTIFATGISVVAKSINCGLSWQVVWGEWNYLAMGVVFIKTDPNASNIIWAGGENGFFWPWLLKSTDAGESWELLDVYNGGDNRCHDIAVYSGNSNNVWVSMEGRVRETSDGGESWNDVLVNNHYLYGIEIDPLRPMNLYTSGGQMSYPLTIFASNNGGATWFSVIEEGYPENWAFDILMESYPNRNVLYLGTEYGVFKYTDIFTLICGDVNSDGIGPDIADLVYLVDYMFNYGPPPPVMNLADVDNSGSIDIADLVYLVHYMFGNPSGPPPVGCQ